METNEGSVGWWVVRALAGIVLGAFVGSAFFGVGALPLAAIWGRVFAGPFPRASKETPPSLTDQR